MEVSLTRKLGRQASIDQSAQSRQLVPKPLAASDQLGDSAPAISVRPKLPSLPSVELARRPNQAKGSWNASNLESRLTAAIAERTRGRLHSLEVRLLGGRTRLSGVASSYHIVQIAVACLLETLSELDLDHPEQIDLNIEVLPDRSAMPRASTPK